MDHERYEDARTWLCRLGAVCAVLNIVAQAFQDIAYRFFIPADDAPLAQLLARNLPWDRARAIVVLLSILALFGVYLATAFDRVRRAPGTAFAGFACMLMFVTFELGYRSIDFFFVTRQWAGEYPHTASESLRQALVDRVAAWDSIVAAIYFPLTLTAAIGQTCFAFSLRGEGGWIARLALFAWGLNAARTWLRVVNFAGVKSLAPFIDAIYFPTILVMYPLLATWLWNQSKTRTSG